MAWGTHLIRSLAAPCAVMYTASTAAAAQSETGGWCRVRLHEQQALQAIYRSGMPKLSCQYQAGSGSCPDTTLTVEFVFVAPSTLQQVHSYLVKFAPASSKHIPGQACASGCSQAHAVAMHSQTQNQVESQLPAVYGKRMGLSVAGQTFLL